jgi:hypothetical protein
MRQYLPLLALVAISATAFAQEQTLFNGKDLNDWEGNPALWSVKDGVIHGETKPTPDNPNRGDLKHNTFLVWKGGVVNDFELRLKYRITSDSGNSGIQYRSAVTQQGEHGPIVSGYQADFEAGKTYSGILYEERGRGILAKRGEQVTVKADPDDAVKHKLEVTGSVGSSQEIQDGIRAKDWNDYVVIAKGNHLQHFINGRKTVDVTDEHQKAAKEGILAFQIHAGPPMVVEFKDVVLKPIK